MKKEFVLALALLALILLALLGLTAWGFSSRAQAAPTCSATLAEILAAAQGDVYNMEGYETYEEPSLSYLVAYSVRGDNIEEPVFESVPADLQDEQADSALQEEAWRVFAELIPAQRREAIAAFRVFTDGQDNTLAAVEQNAENPDLWYLDVDIADAQNRDLLLSTLVHEYAHALTLDSSQVEPDAEVLKNWNDPELLRQKAAACPTYFTDTGCSRPDSYMQAFYQRFWLNLADEWARINAMQYESEDLTPYYDALYQFYLRHADQFVDDYAVTHPTEDIAESFTYFVFSPKPAGDTVKEQKILFFYEYPELRALREQMLNGICGGE